MADICPTVTAFSPHEYREQIVRIESFAKRIHIDLMDGDFAPTKSPSLKEVWWPENLQTDIHLMYRRPEEQLDQLISLKPNLVIIHLEAEVHHLDFAANLAKAGIKAGLALLKGTPVDAAVDVLPAFDHVLVFSGNLGYHGGQADLALLDKVKQLRTISPQIEIAWDGGINDQNAKQLVEAGVDVLNVGGFIQKADNPEARYKTLTSAL